MCRHNSSSIMRAWPFGPHQKTILTLRTPTVTTPISSCPMSVYVAYQVTYPVNVYIPLWFGQMTLELLPSYKHYFSKLVCHCGTTVALELLAICTFTILRTTDNCYFPVFLSGRPRRHWAKGKSRFLIILERLNNIFGKTFAQFRWCFFSAVVAQFFFFVKCFFNSYHRLSVAFRSVLWLGHFNTWISFDLNHFVVAPAVCLGSLSY